MSGLDVTKRLTETITVKRPASHSTAGDVTYAAPFTCSARVQRGQTEVADREGRKLADAAKVITTTELKPGDLVWFAEDDTASVNAARRVLIVHQNRALDGTVISYSSET